MEFNLESWIEEHKVIEKTLKNSRIFIENYYGFEDFNEKIGSVNMGSCQILFEEIRVFHDQNRNMINRIDCISKIFHKDKLLCRYVLCFRHDGEIFDDATYYPTETFI